MRRSVHSNTDSFIVRIWYEETDEAGGAFVRRGSIEHVRTQKRLFFCELEPMIEFIDAQSGFSGEQTVAQGGQDSPAGAARLLASNATEDGLSDVRRRQHSGPDCTHAIGTQRVVETIPEPSKERR
jgi:hypothetical protein